MEILLGPITWRINVPYESLTDRRGDKQVAGGYSYVTLNLIQDKIVVSMKP